ncbi:MAG: RNA-binding transcriptional accessory protein [Gammaproteobacteria bacterium]|nr:RNA-binding transcriptional accessory protein [Gammaproteobacteria bacterium]
MNLARIVTRLAVEVNAKIVQINAAVALLDEGATVPFIARYRKEATGGLDDTQLRLLEERLRYHRELEERRATVLKAIEEDGKLTDELRALIDAAESKVRLEDLYRPYMKKRRTKAQIAKEAGLEPLALALVNDPTLNPELEAASYVAEDKGIADIAAALEGARQILMEQFAEDPELNRKLREYSWENGQLQSKVRDGKTEEGAKFSDYFDAIEAVKKTPSHRALAMLRGQTEEILSLTLFIDPLDENGKPLNPRSIGEVMIAQHFNIVDKGRAGDAWLIDTVRWTWKVKVEWHIDSEIKKQMRELAEEEAIKVFARNLRDLLLTAPAGPRVTMGLDPGIRTGVKIAVVDNTGKVVDTSTVYPLQPRNDWQGSLLTIAALCQKHNVDLIAIGNGTGSRETDKLAGEIVALSKGKIQKIMVSEAGASVYSASELASREFPNLDVSLRGAVSIARRLQDPLAELVKIDPKSIGVGQYQHDVSQVQLARMLNAVVEDCVNAVGVDVNTASAPLLSRVSGLSSSLAENIVSFRDQHGSFKNRQQLLKVTRLGDKAFEQCAGFLKVMNGDNPLDASSVHPEAYPVIERIISKNSRDMRQIIGDVSFLRGLAANDYVDDKFGAPTVRDILAELEKPGRDPRPEFKTAEFKEGIESLADLKPGMRLQGVVTNVANFGAFVDIGVHQDGLVHVSQLANKFVKDPHEVVKTGDVVQVYVVEIDPKRNRISLTMRSDEDALKTGEHSDKNAGKSVNAKTANQVKNNQPDIKNNPFANALAGWKK